MSHRLLLPPLSTISHLEGTGNFAVSKYYHWPWAPIYQTKLKMMLELLDTRRMYRSTLDYGCGAAQIMRPTLEKLSDKITSVDKDDAEPIGKFDLIICGSVLEFVNLDETLHFFQKHLAQGGQIVGASPMDTPMTRLYLISDLNKRHSHHYIMRKLKEYFNVTHSSSWLGLYFSFKAVAK